MRIDKNFIKSPVFLATIVYISVFSFLTTLRYYSFVATAWDLGEFSQSMWTTLHAKKLFYNNVEFGSHFHVHFRPILFLLLPIYALFESPVTLLVLKSILLGFGAIPLYLISKQELKNHFAILFPFLYLLYPALHGANWFDFHPENFVPFFILMSFYYYKKDKTLPYFFFLLLALMTKEDVSLVIISLGLYFLIVNRKLLFKRPVSKEILTPLVTIILGFLWFLFSLQIIQYFLQVDGYAGLTSSGYVHFGNAFGRLGGNGGLLNIVKTVVTNPLLFFQVLFSDYLTKIIFLLALFLPVAFLSFVDIKTILLFSPTLMIYLLADSPNYYSISYQYSGLLVPGIFISAIYGMKKLGFNKSRLGALNIEWIHSHTRLLLISAVVMGVIFFCLVPSISGLLGTDEQSKPIINYHRLALLETLSYIPPNASVLTQREIFPHLSHRLPAYVYYNTTPVEYILIDTASYWYENSALAKEYQMMYGEQPPFPEYVEGILTSGKYGLLIYWDGIYLFKEGYRDEPIIFK